MNDADRFFNVKDFVVEHLPVYDRPVRSIIVAMDECRGIGYQGGIPWKNPLDMKRFRRITMGHPVVMGRKTMESIPGGLLKGRTNVVMSRTQVPHSVYSNGERCIFVGGYGDALAAAAASDGAEEIFVIGGADVYTQALPTIDRLYITMVHGDYKCDACFPNVFDALADAEAWCLVDMQYITNDHVFSIYERHRNGNP